MKLRPRPADAHKGTFGHLLVVAGSRRMLGAACLATQSGLRSGAGLVTLATTASVQPLVAPRMWSAMTVPLAETAAGGLAEHALEELTEPLGRATAVALGPGLGRDPQTEALVLRFVGYRLGDRPAVIDADGLNALAGSLHRIADDVWPSLVLTPHPKELCRLTDEPVADILADPEAAARRFVAAHPGVTLVLKLHRTIIAHADDFHVNDTGHVALATGGSGDVLTGMIGALLAQGYPSLEAARLGVHAHGRAGELADARLGAMAVTAEDLLDDLPAAWRELSVPA